jgi:putative ABC transport system ATP-binding protein
VNLAVRDIRRRPGRFALSCVGVGLLLTLVLSYSGIYNGFVYEAEHLGFIFQAHNLIPFLTARENVLVALQIQGTKGTKGAPAVRIAQELLDYLGVGDRQGHLPEQLSGGEQQRVAIARALANGPQVILADEPTAALDTERGRSVMALFRKIARDKGSAVICVTHDRRMIEGFDHVYHVKDGVVSDEP